ncbi:MAG: PEP-CTERM sorting domain-containing protein [Alphaproteobacteria bacterium]
MTGTFLGRVWVAAVAAVMLAAAQAAAAPISVLIVQADGSPPTAELLATGDFSSVDVFDAESGTPTLAQLQGYDAVLAYTNSEPADPAGLGDVLKDYVDGGGGLVMKTYAFSNPWAIGGGITGTGYAPLVNVGVNGDVSGNIVQTAASPIFDGVNLAALTYYHNSNSAHPALDATATLLADDGGAGIPLIAINAAGNIIGNNMFPGNCCGGNNDEFYRLLANELLVVAGESITPVPEPGSLALLGASFVGWTILRRRRDRTAA